MRPVIPPPTTTTSASASSASLANCGNVADVDQYGVVSLFCAGIVIPFNVRLGCGSRSAVRFAGLDARSRQPALRQFEEDDGLRLVDLEKDRGMDVDADEDDARIVRRIRRSRSS